MSEGSESSDSEVEVKKKKSKSVDLKAGSSICKNIINTTEQRSRFKPESTSDTIIQLVLAKAKKDKGKKLKKCRK